MVGVHGARGKGGDGGVVGGGDHMEGTWWAHGGHAWGKEC